jgi:hypothetical protein
MCENLFRLECSKQELANFAVLIRTIQDYHYSTVTGHYSSRCAISFVTKSDIDLAASFTSFTDESSPIL